MKLIKIKQRLTCEHELKPEDRVCVCVFFKCESDLLILAIIEFLLLCLNADERMSHDDFFSAKVCI